MLRRGTSRLEKIGLLVLIFLLIASPFFSLYSNLLFPSVNAFSPMQSATNTIASGTSINVAFSTNPLQNDFIVVEASDQDGGTISSVTDTLGNTFTNVITDTNTYQAAIYIAQQTHTSGADAVTVNYNGVTQHNISIGIQEMKQITSTTASVTGSGHGTSGSALQLSASITPNINDACFTSGIGLTSTNPLASMEFVTTQIGIAGNVPDSGFGVLWQTRLTSSAAKSTGTFIDYPLSSTSTKAAIEVQNGMNGNTAALQRWEIVAACFPQSQVTTTTTTTTTAATTISTTTTSTSLNISRVNDTTSGQEVIPVLLLGSMALLFSWGSFSGVPATGAYVVQAETVEDGQETHGLYRMGRYLKYLRVIAFQILAFGSWTALGIICETVNICDFALQCTTGSPPALPWDWGLGLLFISIGSCFLVFCFITCVALLRTQPNIHTITKRGSIAGSDS